MHRTDQDVVPSSIDLVARWVRVRIGVKVRVRVMIMVMVKVRASVRVIH